MTDGSRDRVWSVVLALPERERSRPRAGPRPVRRKPEPFCSFTSRRSVFQEMMDVAGHLSLPQQKIAVVAKDDLRIAVAQLSRRKPGRLVAEPAHRGTAPAVFLGLSHIRVRSPRDVVVFLPCSRLVYPQERLVKAIRAAIRATDLLDDCMVLLGVPSHREASAPRVPSIRPGYEHGWIADYRVCSVGKFMDAPDSGIPGTLWNTSILVARAETLRQEGWRCLPEILRPLDKYRAVIGTDQEQAMLEEVYKRMPSRNLIRNFLESSSRETAVMEMTGVLWCDWKAFRHLSATLERIVDSRRIA